MSPSPVVLVTAGSAGLGAAAVRLFAENGYRVVINYHASADKAASLLSSLPTQPGTRGETHACLQADLESREQVERLVAGAHARMGRLDVVFSNGGWTFPRDMASLDDNVAEDEWDRCFGMNVKSHLWLLHAARRHLEAAEGCFVSTASVAGLGHNGSSLAYSVTKAAQLHMIKGLACMVGPRVRVNSVSPGLLQTEWAKRFPPEAQEAHRQKTKLKRFAELEDVAMQVLTLAKSKSMTGVNIVVDAGYII
ncbi:short chain dehydrogenase [Xylariomycetidae sp. FL2044]|nr:short chain dehydrogenase [Xylariomycetidae sp. FL2044]